MFLHCLLLCQQVVSSTVHLSVCQRLDTFHRLDAYSTHICLALAFFAALNCFYKCFIGQSSSNKCLSFPVSVNILHARLCECGKSGNHAEGLAFTFGCGQTACTQHGTMCRYKEKRFVDELSLRPTPACFATASSQEVGSLTSSSVSSPPPSLSCSQM